MHPLILSFNFHEIVRLEIQTSDPRVDQFFSREYHHHRDDEHKPYRAILRLNLNDDTFTLSNPTSFSHKVLARWKYTISINTDTIEIGAHANHVAIPMVHHMLVHPSIRYLCSQQGILMLHAGAVSLNGKSLLFTGKGGAGKTTTTALFLTSPNMKWDFQADDYVFVTPQPSSLAYITRQHLYVSFLRWVPVIKQYLKPGERVSIILFSLLRDWSNERIKWPVRVEPERVWPSISFAMQATPGALILLIRAAIDKPSLVMLNSMQYVLDDLIKMNFYEARHFLALLQKQKLPQFDDFLQAWQKRETELLQQVMSKVAVYELNIPDRIVSPEAIRTQVVELARKLVE
jgi:hypothetical protein